MAANNSRSTSKKPDSLIENIEKKRDTKLITYITGDRPIVSGSPLPIDLSTKVALDTLPIFNEILRKSKTNKITLAIHTNGGLIETPWPLVNLLREYCEEFEVIVLEKALSAGTLISLGADKIVMPRGSFLSPIDPARNLRVKQPKQPQPQPQPETVEKKIEIEDIIGYINFAKEKVGINDQATLGEILKELSKEIDPSIIGSINRTHSLIRRIAHKLIGLQKSKIPEHQSKELIEQLTERLYSHNHLISSREAKEIGFGDTVEIPDQTTTNQIESLFEYYLELMKLREPLNVDEIANKSDEVLKDKGYSEKCITALIHSKDVKYNFVTNVNVKGKETPQGRQINFNIINPKWVKEQ